MKNVLPPKPHSKATKKSVRHMRKLVRGLLTCFGVILATIALKASTPIHRPPYVTFVPNQRVTTAQSFAPQFFRVIDLDGGIPTVMRMSPGPSQNPPNWYLASNISVNKCSGETGCASDGTGWKVSFDNTPGSPGNSTVLIKATGSTGLVAYTTFTLQVVDSSEIANPPTIQNLPNYTVQDGIQTYTTEFVIGDLNENGMEDVCHIDVEGGPCVPKVTVPDPTYT